MRAGHSEPGIHELLPWYVNGTLPEAEAAAFREHLAACAECRAEMGILQKIRDQIDRHGEAFLEAHPAAESLVAAMRGELADSAETARIRRHVALCAACAAEASWVVGEEPVETAERSTEGLEPRRAGRVPWVALAAAASIAGALLLVQPWQQADAPGLRIARPVYVRTAARAIGAENVFTLGPGQSHVDLVFEVDFPPASFPARMEILTADGKRLHLEERIERETLVDGTFLFVDCPRRLCAPGSYIVRIEAAGGDVPELTFRVRVAEP